MSAGPSTELARLRAERERWRDRPWPAPLDVTSHVLRRGDARDLGWVASSSVHLIVTSPPYFDLKTYGDEPEQLGYPGARYDEFLADLDRVWAECRRVLVPGGRVCCVVGDVLRSRRSDGRHHVLPLHSDVQVRARALGLDCLTPIRWEKIANGASEATGAGGSYYGKPFEPGGVVRSDAEHVLFLRRGDGYRSPAPLQRALSLLSPTEVGEWFRSTWTNLPGASTRGGHPAPFPLALAERLVRMFSFAGDVVLDPFVGSGTTSVAALRAGRSSLGVDASAAYLRRAAERLGAAARAERAPDGPTRATVELRLGDEL